MQKSSRSIRRNPCVVNQRVTLPVFPLAIHMFCMYTFSRLIAPENRNTLSLIKQEASDVFFPSEYFDVWASGRNVELILFLTQMFCLMLLALWILQPNIILLQKAPDSQTGSLNSFSFHLLSSLMIFLMVPWLLPSWCSNTTTPDPITDFNLYGFNYCTSGTHSLSVYISLLLSEEEEVEQEEEEVLFLLAAELCEDLWQMGPSHKTHSLGRNSSPRTFHRVPRFTWSEGCVCPCVRSEHVQRKPGRLSWPTQNPSAPNLWRPQIPPPPNTHCSPSTRRREAHINLMTATHVAGFAYLQMHRDSYFEIHTHRL